MFDHDQSTGVDILFVCCACLLKMTMYYVAESKVDLKNVTKILHKMSSKCKANVQR